MEELPNIRGVYGPFSRLVCSTSIMVNYPWIDYLDKNGVGIYMGYGGGIFVKKGRIPLGIFLEPKSMRICSWNVHELGGSQTSAREANF